jgi:23S rRNA pseudouridine1911/1915/1917 synthase
VAIATSSQRASVLQKCKRSIVEAILLSSPEVYGSDSAEDGDDPATAADGTAPQRFVVAAAQGGERLDKLLASLLPQLSRSRLQQWIEAAAVRVDGRAVRPRHAVPAGAVIDVEPQPAPDAAAYSPERMALDIVHEDAAILVVDKPAGLVVHPAAGHWSGTLLNGLLAHAPELAAVPRAGIVHRLDADTSGLMVVARTLAAQTDLVRQLQARTVERRYWALVLGEPRSSGSIDGPIGRDARNPLRFRVSRAAGAREARTHYLRLASAQVEGVVLSWVECRLETGRTHQIRVHFEHLGHPLVGDPLYRRRLPPPLAGVAWRSFPRQALHAAQLGLVHPVSGSALRWFRPPPADMRELMRAIGFGPLDRPRAAEAA